MPQPDPDRLVFSDVVIDFAGRRLLPAVACLEMALAGVRRSVGDALDPAMQTVELRDVATVGWDTAEERYTGRPGDEG